MTKATGSKLVDSSVWLAYYFEGAQQAKTLIDSDLALFSSVLSFFEVERRLRSLHCEEEKIFEFLDFMDLRSTTLFVDRLVTSLAVQLSVVHKLGAVDAILLASAQIQNLTLVTGDYDFHTIDGVEILRR